MTFKANQLIGVGGLERKEGKKNSIAGTQCSKQKQGMSTYEWVAEGAGALPCLTCRKSSRVEFRVAVLRLKPPSHESKFLHETLVSVDLPLLK